MLFGFRKRFVHADTGARVMASCAVAGMLLLWCTLDAPAHGKSFEHGFALPLMFIWPVGLVAYLLWTRGRRGLLSYVRALAIAVATIFAIGVTVYFVLPPRAVRAPTIGRPHGVDL